MSLTESVVEDTTLAWLESLGYTIKHGPEIAPGEFFRANGLRGGGCGGLRGQLVQKVQQLKGKGNMQKMHIVLKRQGTVRGLAGSWTATGAKSATVQMWPGNCFRKGNSWTLSCRCG